MMSPDAFNDRTYYVVLAADVSKIDFSEVLEASALTVRYNSDASKAFVCYESASLPSSLIAIKAKEGPYTNDDILSMLDTPEWEIVTENLPSEPDPFLA